MQVSAFMAQRKSDSCELKVREERREIHKALTNNNKVVLFFFTYIIFKIV
jgi:hypothetical protein